MSINAKRARATTLPTLLWLSLTSTLSCGVDEVGYPPPTDALYYPLGIAAHPEGRYLYVSSASYDRLYNASSLIAIDTQTHSLMSKTAVELGLFSGELTLASRGCEGGDAECSPELLAYLPSRDEHSLTTFILDASQGDSARHIQCGQGLAEGGEGRRCASAHVTVEAGETPMPKGPYALRAEGEHLYMTHLNAGVLTRWRVPSREEDSLGRPLFECKASTGNAHFVSVHPVSGDAFVSDRLGQRVQVVRAVERQEGGCKLSPQAPLLVTDKLVSGEGRGVAMSADGTRMYLASSFDGALRVYDVSIGSDGAPRNALLAAIPVGRSANAVRVAGLRPDEHRASTQAQGSAERVVDARGGGLIYVTALEDGVVVVIDPQRLAVIARIKVGASPHDVAFLPTDEGGLNAYVTNFKAHSVSVIDVTEGSETRFQVTHTIGGEGS